MKNKSLLMLLGSIFLILILGALPFVTSCAAKAPPGEETINLICADTNPQGFWNTWYQPAFARAIEAATDYRVKTRYYGGGTLLTSGQEYAQVIAGIADIGETIFAYTPGRFPLMATLEQSIPYKNSRVCAEVAWDVFNKFKPAELSDVHILWLYCTGPGVMATKKPVRTLEDLQGLTIRTSAGIAPIVTALGATPVPLPQEETYISLQKGIIQGTLVAPADIKEMNYFEVLDYVTVHPLGIGNVVIADFMNLEKWNSLPPDIQEAITKVAEEYREIAIGVWDEYQSKAIEELKLVGMEIIYLSPEESARWVEKAKPFRDQYIADLEAKGLPGQEVLDYIMERTEYWNKQ